jgi:hypothetical protein
MNRNKWSGGWPWRRIMAKPRSQERGSVSAALPQESGFETFQPAFKWRSCCGSQTRAPAKSVSIGVNPWLRKNV